MTIIQRRSRARLGLRKWAALAAVAIAPALFSACSESSRDEAATGADSANAVIADDQASNKPTGAIAPGEASASAAAGSGGAAAPVALPAGRDIIVTVDVGMTSDDLQKSVQVITKTAADSGGYLDASDIVYDAAYGSTDSKDGGDTDTSYATLTVRVPTTATTAFVDALAKAGTIVSSSQGSQDVTGQVTDLEIRIANTRDSIESVRALLAKATEMSDIVYLEQELSNRVTTLEQLEAQLRGLSDQAAMSTVNITIRPPAAAEELKPEDTSIGGFFRAGWNAFAATIGVIVRIIAVTLPFVVTGGLIALIIRRLVRWNRRRRPAPQRLTTPPTVPTATPQHPQTQNPPRQNQTGSRT